MNFIEVKNRYGDKTLINFDHVVQVNKLFREDDLGVEIIDIHNDRIWLKERYDCISHLIRNRDYVR